MCGYAGQVPRGGRLPVSPRAAVALSMALSVSVAAAFSAGGVPAGPAVASGARPAVRLLPLHGRVVALPARALAGSRGPGHGAVSAGFTRLAMSNGRGTLAPEGGKNKGEGGGEGLRQRLLAKVVRGYYALLNFVMARYIYRYRYRYLSIYLSTYLSI